MDWLLPSAVLLLGMGVAVAVLAHQRRAKETSSSDDSWERSEERRRRKEALMGTASYLLLFCCAAVAAALSFHGLVGFGQQNLGLSGGWEYLVPFGLDGAAMFCSVLAVREASHGDAALGSRLLVWTFAGAAAWFNWVHAPRGIDHAGAPQFFAGMSLSAAVLFDRALKQTRRAALREQGLVPRPLPQIRIVRWLRAPRETFGAWSLMLLENVRTLDEAVDEVREDRRQKEQNRLRRRDQHKMERARLKAITRSHRRWPTRGGRQVDIQGGHSSSAPALPSPESAGESSAHAEQLPMRSRPSLQAIRSGGDSITVDLTAEDDTQTLPRLDSLERKLKDLEQQFG
ncbi:membrane protein [Streptomyces sulfonofaciens]|uniref:Membrane protein n=2 Tax=Streptomyces sulfonofaciens TaxID=68272 RepID=A0A919G8S1_9ACTN|nr:membrane protein [Streptomyces sulfonofaciens]